MSLFRLVLVLFAGAAVSVGLVACGDDDDDAGDGTAAATTAAPDGGGTSPAASGAAGDVVKVTAKDFAFDPADVDAPANNEVTFQLTNSDSATHTLTVYEDDAYTKKVSGASVQVSGGKEGEFNVTFPKTGEFYFRCDIHPQMQGEIKVQ